MFTKETLKQALPVHVKQRVTDDLLDSFNQLIPDPDQREAVGENFVTYATVLQEGRFKMENYLQAVMYCTYKLQGDNNQEAWMRTFPDRYARLVANGASEKEISAHVSGYSKNQLVNKIMAQAMIPTHILNAHHYQEAINKQVHLMRHAKSERIQLEASRALTDGLKAPEVKKVELDVGVSESSAIQELKEVTAALAAQQVNLISSGATTAEQTAHQRLVIEGKCEEVE